MWRTHHKRRPDILQFYDAVIWQDKPAFAGFEAAFEAPDRRSVTDERLSVFSGEQIAEKGNSLNLGLIRDEVVVEYAELPDPLESGEEAVAQLEEALDLLKSVVNELKSLRA